MASEHTIRLEFPHRVLPTRDVFAPENRTLPDLLAAHTDPGRPSKILFIADANVLAARPTLAGEIADFCTASGGDIELAAPVFPVPGGEPAKNDWPLVEKIWAEINRAKLDRHCYVVAIGGGAVLDLVGFAAATAHRGIRHIRMPTTTLSQGDGGVGVKNGVNFFGKKNWIGTFTIPFAIINDYAFLDLLPDREKRAGIIEAIKVALIRDADFFYELEENAPALAALETTALERVVERGAELHIEHIATSGDPFEFGSARPLDFGHWIAHKLEQVSGFAVGHGEAVAIGIAADLLYSVEAGILDGKTAHRIIDFIEKIGFATYSEYLDHDVILEGLDEFREHLGGELTITLVPQIGQKLEVHEMDREHILTALKQLQDRASAVV